MLLTPFSLCFAIIFISATTLCNGETLIEAQTEKPTSLSNNSEISENLIKSSVACPEITQTHMPEWKIKLEEAQAEAKKLREERKERVKRFQEEYKRWMKLPLADRRVEMKKWFAERRKERQERAKIRREKILAQIEAIRNKNKLKALPKTATQSTTIEPSTIESTTVSPTTESSISPTPTTEELINSTETGRLKNALVTENATKASEEQQPTSTVASSINALEGTEQSVKVEEEKKEASKTEETNNNVSVISEKEKPEIETIKNTAENKEATVYNNATEQPKIDINQEKPKNEEPKTEEIKSSDKSENQNIEKEKEEKAENLLVKAKELNQPLESKTPTEPNKIQNEEKKEVKIKA
uniref:Uncharacterized protein n=1 Tax=Meloidogyne enterolobii TaxID=390850 RepID=A0A6V7TZU8_MELEN|nr:unnamed protein product [Meloidogyne enterolobii]